MRCTGVRYLQDGQTLEEGVYERSGRENDRGMLRAKSRLRRAEGSISDDVSGSQSVAVMAPIMTTTSTPT